MNQKQFFHNYFYNEADSTKTFRLGSVSYQGTKVYSYATQIGEIVEARDGRTYFLVSKYSMSRSTGKQLGYLQAASPFPIVQVPYEYGRASLDLMELAENLFVEIREFDVFNTAFREMLWQFERLSEAFNFFDRATDIKIPAAVSRKMVELREEVRNVEACKKLRRKYTSKKRKELQELLGVQTDISYFDIIRFVFDRDFPSENMEKLKSYRTQLTKLFRQTGNSYVYRIGDAGWKTSQYVIGHLDQIRKPLQDWKNGKLTECTRIAERFDVQEVTPEFVKVGCHKIPVENVYALYEFVVNSRNITYREAVDYAEKQKKHTGG